MSLLVDTNILIDVLTDDPTWADWSEEALLRHAGDDPIVNPAIFAELCFGCDSLGEAENIVRQFGLGYSETPRDGLFRAAKAFAQYKNNGGTKDFVLPDFFVGGHAEAASLKILTRDEGRYRTYFPNVTLICP